MSALIGVGVLIGIPYLLFAAFEIGRAPITKVYFWLHSLI